MLGGVAALALVLLQIMGAGVMGRFEIEGVATGGRLETYRATIRMIMDHPWFGSGLGTYAWAYPAYRSPHISSWGVWDRAHSTPLELAADLGLPLALLIVLAWLVVLVILLHGVRANARDRIPAIAALAVALIALVHSCVDFSLQIPGYAIVVFALAGAGLARSVAANGRSPAGNAMYRPVVPAKAGTQ
jgi:O-antigen ligase